MTTFVRNGTTGDNVGEPDGGNDAVGACDRVGGAVGGAVGDAVGCLTGEVVGPSVGASPLSIGDAVGVSDE